MADEVTATVMAAFRLAGVPAGGPDDSLFQLGGDSVAAARVITSLNGIYSVRIPFAELYRDSTPAAIARVIDALRAAPRASRRSIVSVARRRRRTWFPLALNQEALYTMDAATGGAGLFNNVGLLRFSGDIDPAALSAALTDTVRRQSALRIVFGQDDGTPAQRFTDEIPEITSRDLRGQGEPALRMIMRRELLRGFDLHGGPPVRFTLARTADDAWALVSTVHHIVFDGLSQGLFVDDLAHAYACRVGQATPKPPLHRDYADFVEWQRDNLCGERLEAHLDAIRAALRGGPPPRLSPGNPRSSSFLVRAKRFPVPEAHAHGLRELASSCGTTVFVVLVAALLDFVALRTAHHLPAVAVQAANRSFEGIEETVGCFANTVLVAVERPDSPDPATHVRVAGKAVGAALQHQELPLELTLRLLGERDLPGGEHLPQIGFAMQPPRTDRREVPGGIMTAHYADEVGDAVDPTSFALVLEMFSEDGGLDGVLHRRVAEWPDDAYDAALADLSATFARFGAAGRPGPRRLEPSFGS